MDDFWTCAGNYFSLDLGASNQKEYAETRSHAARHPERGPRGASERRGRHAASARSDDDHGLPDWRGPVSQLCASAYFIMLVRCSRTAGAHALLMAPLILAAILAPNAHAAAPVAASWQASALGKVQELETTLAQKEHQLLQARADLAAARGAEERGGRRMVRRAAFDVGSAACKVVVADVDLHAGSVPAITETIFSERVAVQLSDDLAAGQGAQFTERTLQELQEVLYEFKKRAEQAGAEQFAGIATAAFRKARNGPDFLLKLQKEGLALRIISQEREAMLGFLTANHLCQNIPAYDLVAWDCGGGSFQITAEVPPGFESWMKTVGTSVAKTLLLTKVYYGLSQRTCRPSVCCASTLSLPLLLAHPPLSSSSPLFFCVSLSRLGVLRCNTKACLHRRIRCLCQTRRRLPRSLKLFLVMPQSG